MTVVFVKSECPRHPGRFTMGEPCDLCCDEAQREWLDGFLAELRRSFRRELAGLLA